MVFLRFNKIRIIKIATILIDYFILYFLCKSNFSLINSIVENKINLFFLLLFVVSINYLIGKYDYVEIQNTSKMIIYFFKKNVINFLYIFIALIFSKINLLHFHYYI